MITDRQVRLLRQKRMEGKTQETAAVKAGMSVRSARKWQSGPLPSATKPEHRWGTRPDPFDGAWEDEIEPLLRNDPTGNQYPDLDSVEDLKTPRFKSLFATATSGGKARLVSCVSGWQCEEDNAAQVRGYGLSDHVEIFNPASGPALDADLLNAYEIRQSWLGFQWASNEPALRIDLARLSELPYNQACWSITKACAYEEDTILIASNAELPNSAPDVASMLRRWDFGVDTIYRDVVRWRFDNPDSDIDATALWWLNNHGSIWSQWVTDAAATSIRAALNAGEIPAGWG